MNVWKYVFVMLYIVFKTQEDKKWPQVWKLIGSEKGRNNEEQRLNYTQYQERWSWGSVRQVLSVHGSHV